MRSILLISTLLLPFLNACSTKDEKIQVLLSSPESWTSGSLHFTISAFLWRDFMPVSVLEAEGSSLYASITLTESNQSPIPADLVWEKVYLVNGDKLWEAEFFDTVYQESWQLEGSASNGPKWGPDINVDVIGEGVYKGERFRILLKNQPIIKTS